MTEEQGINLRDISKAIKARAASIVSLPLILASVAYFLASLVPPTYVATLSILPPQQQQASSVAMAQAFGAVTGMLGAGAVKNPVDQYISLLKSRSVQTDLVIELALREKLGARQMDEAIEKLNKRLKITGGKDGIILVEVEDVDPVQAAAIANHHVAALRKLMKRLALTEANQRRVFFEAQVREAREELERAGEKVQSVSVENGELRRSASSTMAQYIQLESIVAQQEARVAAYSRSMTDATPEMKGAKSELERLKTKLAVLKKGWDHAGEGEGYLGAYRDFKYKEAVLETLLKQLEIYRVEEARDPALIQVVDAATPPERPTGPRKLRIAAVTAIVSLLAAAYVSVFLEVRRRRDLGSRD